MKRRLIYLLVFLCPIAATLHAGVKKANISVECREAVSSPVIDGDLMDEAWRNADWQKDFKQSVPRHNEDATEQTEVAFLYDKENIYVAIRCFDDTPEEIRATKLRHRDHPRNDDFVEVILDTYQDQVRGYIFTVNPLGAKEEGQVNGSRQYNWDWDEVWTVYSTITDDGWQAEFSIPLRILRFADKECQNWGINVRRMIQRKREDVYLVPPAPPNEISNLIYAAKLSGLHRIQQEHTVQIKPFGLMGTLYNGESDTTESLMEGGFDLKYAVTSDLTLDVTYNTDFAQVESDNEQINLTRFSISYPEKREFFLENAQLFNFGNAGYRRMSDTPFFSRTIGIYDGEEVPISYGARLSGKVGNQDIGILSIRTEAASLEEIDLAAGIYNVFRVRRKLTGRSYVGGIVTHSKRDDFTTATVGADGQWFFNDELNLSSNYVKVYDDTLEGDTTFTDTRLDYTSDLIGYAIGFKRVGEDYVPDLGYVHRTGYEEQSYRVRRSFRPFANGIRRISLNGGLEWAHVPDGPLENSAKDARFELDFDSGDNLQVRWETAFERLFEPWELDEDYLTFPIGEYEYSSGTVEFRSSHNRRWNMSAECTFGGYYDGDRTEYRGSAGYIFNRHVSVNGSYRQTKIDTPHGNLDWKIWSSRVSYVHNSFLSVTGFFQYNSSSGYMTTNLRFRMIHSNDSDLFIVLNDRRLNELDRWTVDSRDAIVKVTYRIFI